MSKSWYKTLCCDDCGTPIGYTIEAGPRSTVICDDCYSKEPEPSDEEDK